MTGTVSPLPWESQNLGQGGQRPDEFSRRVVQIRGALAPSSSERHGDGRDGASDGHEDLSVRALRLVREGRSQHLPRAQAMKGVLCTRAQTTLPQALTGLDFTTA